MKALGKTHVEEKSPEYGEIVPRTGGDGRRVERGKVEGRRDKRGLWRGRKGVGVGILVKSVYFDTGDKVKRVTNGGAEEEQSEWNGLRRMIVRPTNWRKGERDGPSGTKTRLHLPCTCPPIRDLSLGFYGFD
jgi:hypothetical protein